jgi:hypothetical protein
MARVAPWTDLEGHLGLWTACFPALQPLLRLVSYKMGLRSTLGDTPQTSTSKSGTGTRHSQWTGRRAHGYVNFSADKEDTESGRGMATSVTAVGSGDVSPSDDMYELEIGDLKPERIATVPPVVRNPIYKRTDVRIRIGAAPQVPEKDVRF